MVIGETQGLTFNDYVCLHTGIDSQGENTSIYGYVRDVSQAGRLTILVERTVIDPNVN